jgi:hypothetical protein
MAEKYNGWTNYETWNVKLWMDNDQGSYAYYGELAQEVYDASKADGNPGDASYALAERIKDEYESAMADLLDSAKASSTVWADLLGAALSEVNWHEIAEHLIEDVDKEETAELETE